MIDIFEFVREHRELFFDEQGYLTSFGVVFFVFATKEFLEEFIKNNMK